ncbi:hypothetical protein B0H63DRAFT_513889 [Podospora didyma]|uniref:DUF7924 domain-containing protein n=1 Tax=Podospora didyma TaxID=330526 RepID=A0AAE0N710_9PEZI|nr:hypothetical protein B0H63DRAFT_513889 [Podospora didyma]
MPSEDNQPGLSSSTNSESPSQRDPPAPSSKRYQPVKDALEVRPDEKRPQIFPVGNISLREPGTVPGSTAPTQADAVAFWTKEGCWPGQLILPSERMSTHTLDPIMECLLARRKPSFHPSISGDQKLRDDESAPYDARYHTLLGVKRSYMKKAPLDMAPDSQAICQALLEMPQPIPKINTGNESRAIHDISRLIVPSAEALATFGAKHLDILAENVNDSWSNCIPFTISRPQPSYSVGFRREAFTKEQLIKLEPFVGEFIYEDESFFMDTYYTYFPFLTCEVKCGDSALDIADRQNAHSRTLAVRAVVELFRVSKRKSEINRQILGFSISHDHRLVRIYGHYPVIEGSDTKYYRHPIREVSFAEMEGRDKWAAYRFTRNVYDE